ncbi:MAG: FAD-dependent oxidoreductase, partial [Sinobacterium sp.]
MSIKTSEVDVLIIGAGISGIGTAYHLQKHCSTKSYAVIEARSDVGGTWDLFRYPGIRSDSDMFTFGFNFKPWRSAKAIS